MSRFETLSILVESVKAAGAILIPVLLAWIGIYIHRNKSSYESVLTQRRETLERRFAKFDRIASLINDLYCFAVLVGHYKSISPEDNLKKKRELESLFFSTLPLWDDGLCKSFKGFIDACFITKRGPGKEAVSCADVVRHRQERASEWDEKWESLFADQEERNIHVVLDNIDSYRNDLVKPRYAEVLSRLSQSVGSNLSAQGVLDILKDDSPTATMKPEEGE